MRVMFNQMFSTIALFFSALEAFASALKHIGSYTEESAATFADTARIERQNQIAKLMQP